VGTRAAAAAAESMAAAAVHAVRCVFCPVVTQRPTPAATMHSHQ
jgi:hypothetical protein